jgi:hypothetical protein
MWFTKTQLRARQHTELERQPAQQRFSPLTSRIATALHTLATQRLNAQGSTQTTAPARTRGPQREQLFNTITQPQLPLTC